MKYGCIGEKLSHSFSKEIHNLIADYDYRLKEIEKDELSEFMTKASFEAINVTIPYKEAVIPYLDTIDEHAKKIGAVNTIVKRNGKLHGYNTDFYGMISLIKKLCIDVSGKKAAILGSGGTSKTAHAVLEHLGARQILTVSRGSKAGCINYDELYKEHTDTEIIINTTPVGMYPKSDACPIKLDSFTRLSGVVDAVYNPLRTNLVLEAKKKGIPAECGLYMLVMQAIYASELFQDIRIDKTVADKVFKKILNDKENIVLVGMPSSGKSTVGAIVAKKLGRELVDTDTIIVERAKKSIKEIFEEDGETVFRQIESNVIFDISKKNGLVIATGGGAVLKDENVNALLQNGKIYHLDRPLELLFPTDSRPLSSDREALIELYKKRHSIYNKVADVTVDAGDEAEIVAQKITGDYNK